MNPLRVGIDASGLVAGKPATGLQRYLASLVTHLEAQSSSIQLWLYFNQPVPPEHLSSFLSNRRAAPFARGWNRLGMGLTMRLDHLDVFHFPAPLMARYCPVPSVVTFHDLAALSLDPEHTAKERRYLNAALDAGRRASALIAVSGNTRDEIRRHLGRDAAVIPEGVDLARFRPDTPGIEDLRRKYRLGRYLLCAGTIQTRKNHIRLIQAFERIAPQIPHTLVIIGMDGSGAEALNDYLSAHPNPRIQRLGYVPEAELPALLAGADALALVSLWEGFGLPLLEAMAAGTPAVTSNSSALAEIAGDAAVLVDPYDVDAIAAGLLRVLTDEGAALREKLIEAGKRRARAYSWDAAAQRTIDVYRQTAARR